MNRILVWFTPNNELVPFDNQIVINSYVNKILGENNEYHGKQKKFSVSRLIGGTKVGEGLNYANGGYICFTSNDDDILNKVINGVITNPKLKWGMSFKNIEVVNEMFYNGWNHFFTLTPFILKTSVVGKKDYYHTFNDADFTEVVKQRLIKKLSATFPGVNLSDFDVKITPPNDNKVSRVKLGGANIRVGNKCQISIFSNSDVAKKIYCLGIGQSTGSMGLGTIYKTENHQKYYI